MVTQVLARKWRPRSFAELVGQEHVVRALGNALTQQRLHHAYLFTGTRGVGKTTIARIIAKALNCETGVTAEPCGKCRACTDIDAGRYVDLIELDAASNTQVDSMRELLENALYAPTGGRFKVYIIDEVHMLSRSAFNAMLKTLEEPPGHVKFILATTDPQRIPVTVLSRCLQFNLKQIPQPQIRGQLSKVLELEKIGFEDEALALLARAARGSMRDSLSLLDQAIAHGGGKVETASVRAMLGSVEREYLRDILAALQATDGAAMIAVADRMAERSLSSENALQDLGTLLHRVALVQAIPSAIGDDDPERAHLTEMAAAFSAEEIQLYYQIALQGRQEIGYAPDEYAGFTMTLMRMLAFAPGAGGKGQVRPATAATPSPVRPAARNAAPAANAEGSKKKNSIDGDWTAFVAGLPLAGMERMLAHNCELVSWQDGRLELRVAHAQRHLNSRSYMERLQQALELHIGSKIRLEISVGEVDGQTVAAVRDREQRQQMSEAAKAIDGDPFVRDLIENFDARVVPSSIKPLH
ncbi:MAG: DNA polymerase III subunit gamma/tau [Betaproteobacteria bacterium]|nr:DNA polymerase III subunit gamma/tau [Betaproteobacteria bacterium]